MKSKTLWQQHLQRTYPLIKLLISGSVDATWGPKLYGKGNSTFICHRTQRWPPRPPILGIVSCGRLMYLGVESLEKREIFMSLLSQSNWPSIRRGLILLMLLIGGMSMYSLFLGRPGDFGGGLVGMAFGGVAGLIVVLVEVIGRWTARRQARSVSEGSSSDESTPASGSKL
jgi:hypothetical protein